MSIYDEVAASADIGRPSARKAGRNPNWPYVPIIVTVDGGGIPRQQQILGRAFATREEAVTYAADHIVRWRANLARQLAEPRMRALRESYGLPREV